MPLSPIAKLVVFISLSLVTQLALASQDDLRKGASGSGDLITNSSGTVARRRTRSRKPSRPNSQSSMTAVDYFNQGNDLIDKRDYAGAIKALEKAISIDPKFQDGYYALSDAYFLANDATDTNSQKSIDADRQGREVAASSGTLIQGGLLNESATKLAEPVYPPIARASRTSGTVKVQVLINEEGAVMSARAVEGQPLLRTAAVKAAMESTFKPTTLDGKPAKVAGTLDFVFQL